MRAKRSVLTGTKESKLVNQVWTALGIDPKTTPNHLTLGEIGMESMFAVELQQGLEREYDIKVTLNDIKNITIGMMKDFESGKVDEMKKFATDIKACRAKLSKVKFVIPSDAYVRLNNVTTGKPIYFLPPLEGIFSALEPLAEKMNRPVIGLNWLRDMENMRSLKEISRYYINLMKALEPKGNYDIVGHFYGALIAMKMLKRAPINRAVIIDMLSEVKLDEECLTDDYLIDLILKLITKDLPTVMHDKMSRDIQTKPDVPSKLAKISDELKEFVGKSLVSRDLEEILNNSFKRAKLFTTYRLNMKKKLRLGQLSDKMGKKFLEMSGKVLIIKPFEAPEDIEEIGDVTDQIKNAYFLPEQVCSYCHLTVSLIANDIHSTITGNGRQTEFRDREEHQQQRHDRVLQHHIGVDEQVLGLIAINIKASFRLINCFHFIFNYTLFFILSFIHWIFFVNFFDSYLIYKYYK